MLISPTGQVVPSHMEMFGGSRLKLILKRFQVFFHSVVAMRGGLALDLCFTFRLVGWRWSKHWTIRKSLVCGG